MTIEFEQHGQSAETNEARNADQILFPTGISRYHRYTEDQQSALDYIIESFRADGQGNNEVAQALPEVPISKIQESTNMLLKSGRIQPFSRGRRRFRTLELFPKQGSNTEALKSLLEAHLLKHPGKGVILSELGEMLGLTRQRISQIYGKIAAIQPVPSLAEAEIKKAKLLRVESQQRNRAREISEETQLKSQVKQLHNQGVSPKEISIKLKRKLDKIGGIVGKLIKAEETKRQRPEPSQRRKRRTSEELETLDTSVEQLRIEKLGNKKIAAKLSVPVSEINNSIRRLEKSGRIVLKHRNLKRQEDWDPKVLELSIDQTSGTKIAELLSLNPNFVKSSINRLIKKTFQTTQTLEAEIQDLRDKGFTNQNLSGTIRRYHESVDQLNDLQKFKQLRNRQFLPKKY